MKLEGKVAIVTGGAAGIGLGIVLCLAEEGADVVIGDINGDAARKAASDVEKLGRKALAIETDLTDKKKVAQVVQQTIDTFGKIDIVVNNVGGNWVKARADRTSPEFTAQEEAEWDETFQLNMKSHVFMSQAVIPYFIEQKSGKIVNISSIAGQKPAATPYSVCKAGDIALTKALAKELAEHNINVNCVCPGGVYTAFHENMIIERIKYKDPSVMGLKPSEYREYFEKRAAGRLLKRAQTAEDMGRAVVFLVSEDAKNITGEILSVSGGSLL